jgi:hypothetical protein
MVDVFVNGVKFVNGTDFTATDGTTVALAAGLAAGNIVEIDNLLTAYLPTNALRTITTFTATAGQTTFSVSYTQGLIDVFYNGSNLAQSEYTATNGTSIILATACQLNDIVVVYAYSYSVGAYSGIAGSGTTGKIPKFTASSSIGDSIITESGTVITVAGSIGTTALNMNNMTSLGSISGGSIYLPSTAIINFRSSTGTTSYGSIAADTSSNLIFNNNVGIGMTPDVNLQVKAISGNTTTFRIGPSASGFELSQDNGGFTVCTIKNIYGSTSASAELALKSGFLTFYSGTSLTERMRIRSDGNIGINDSGSSLVKLAVQGQSTGSSDYVSAWYNSAGTTLFYVRNDGYGFINAAAWAYGSDLRIKENILDVENGLDMVLKMKPKHFDYINGTKDNLGFIAQDVQEIIPQAVSVSNEKSGMLALKTDFLVPYLVKAIQEMNTKIIELEKLVATK